MSDESFQEAIAGCLLGCAVGDAIGLPYEGLGRRRVSRLINTPLRHKLVFGRGMVSDDTDHTVFVAQSILLSSDNAEKFQRALATRLRLWLATLPAGIGYATLRSIMLLCIGVPPQRSGVRSAGNGPSMRSAIIGCYFYSNPTQRARYVEASTYITHRDPLALAGATAVAEVASKLASKQWVSRPSIAEFTACLRAVSREALWHEAVDKIAHACASEHPLEVASQQFGSNGISGFTLHSVPFALIAWHTHFGNFQSTLEAIVRAGGDTDTVGAIAGALAGISVGVDGIPSQWANGITDWPHNPAYLRALAAKLSGVSVDAGIGFRFGLFLRSPLFMMIVLTHGLRRMLPPY